MERVIAEGGAVWSRGPGGGGPVSRRAGRPPIEEGAAVGPAPGAGGGAAAAGPGARAIECDPARWAQAQFGGARLKDRRRVARLVALAGAVARDPGGGLPRAAGSWGDLKAAYRLLARPEATFDSVAAPHWEATRRDAPAGLTLILDDTTEIDFGPTRRAEGLGPVGSGTGRGFLLHSGLMVAPDSGRVLGLAGQVLFHRVPAPKGETRTQRKSRDRESEVWGRLIERVGRPPEGSRWVHVMDRGADDFEVHARARRLGADWVGRVKSRNRRVTDAAGADATIAGVLDAAPEAAGFALELRARPGRPARRAEVAVSFAAVEVRPPRMMAASLKALDPAPIGQWLVRAREARPPAGAEPIDWVLLTSLPVTDAASAMAVIGHYERRWIIEEWHKALKTGCRVEARQLETSAGLEALTGILSATAVRLLQLRGLARSEPTLPASACLPAPYVEALRGVQRVRPPSPWTIREFVRALARLGGFLGRKSDGEPGWQTIWEGWERLNWILRGYDLARATAPPLDG